MAVKIKFDNTHNAEQPTFILAKRNGEKIGKIPALNIDLKDNLSYPEVSFSVYKEMDSIQYKDWDILQDFKLVWCIEWNMWFEIYCEIDESDDTKKNITGKSLGAAELSQIRLYEIEINNENDIARSDYEPTVLYDSDNKNSSLLNRIMEKAPHYKIIHVDDTIKNIQRTFSFDDKTLLDSFNEIAEEIGCIFELNAYSDGNGNIVRGISVYDLQSYCYDCDYRGEFSDTCPKCGSTHISEGYGEDTSVFISTDNLADSVTFSTDTSSVKNCFKLVAGDDLMTATIANCNPNGSGYIWYISDKIKEDMSDELVGRINAYDKKYNEYQNTHKTNINSDLINKYSVIVEKYKTYAEQHDKEFSIPSPIVGYPALMNAYYNAIDFYSVLRDELMPTYKLADTNAAEQAKLLSSESLSPVAVQNIDTCSGATAKNAVLSMAKAIIDSRYQVKANDNYSYNPSTKKWTGSFTVTNYSDDEDTAVTNNIEVAINDNFEKFAKQKIEKVLSNENNEAYDIVSLFKKGATDSQSEFENELKKYCLASLQTFYDSCQACLDILLEQGLADRATWANKNPDLYAELYLNYYQKLGCIQNEIAVRETEIAVIEGVQDENGKNITDGIKTLLEKERNLIQKELDFQSFLGNELWIQFIAYRREDTYSNDNYISDGLSNAELFKNALDFIEKAENDIYKSATLQHSISANLKNLLVMKEFEPIVDHFAVGNWIRIRVDDKVYKLRLAEYSIDFDNPENLDVEFSDVTEIKNGYTDIENILSNMKSISSSYNNVTRQAEQGANSGVFISRWLEEGLSTTVTKIVNDSDNQDITWDSHGILLREYLPFLDEYDVNQTKIISKGLYVTNDNWQTAKAGIGKYIYYDPKDGKEKEAYGVIADTICSNLILSNEVGIYTKDGMIEIGDNGIVINTNKSKGKSVFTIQKDNGNGSFDKMAYIDDNGNLCIKGNITANSLELGDNAFIEQNDIRGLTDNLANITESAANAQKTANNASTTANDAKASANIANDNFAKYSNLLINSGEPTSDWCILGEPKVIRGSVQTGAYPNGFFIEVGGDYGNVFLSHNSTTKENYIYSSRARIQPNTTYTISFDIRASANFTSIDVFFLSTSNTAADDTEYDSDGIQSCNGISSTSAGSLSGMDSRNDIKLEADAWVRKSVTFTTRAGKYSGYIRIDNNGSTSDGSVSKIRVKNIKLEVGTKATAWYPSIYDAVNNGGVVMTDGKGRVMGVNPQGATITRGDEFTTITLNGTEYTASNNGLLIAANAFVSGTIVASQGIIAGFELLTEKDDSEVNKPVMKNNSDEFNLYPNGFITNKKISLNFPFIGKITANINSTNFLKIKTTDEFIFSIGYLNDGSSITITRNGGSTEFIPLYNSGSILTVNNIIASDTIITHRLIVDNFGDCIYFKTDSTDEIGFKIELSSEQLLLKGQGISVWKTKTDGRHVFVGGISGQDSYGGVYFRDSNNNVLDKIRSGGSNFYIESTRAAHFTCSSTMEINSTSTMTLQSSGQLHINTSSAAMQLSSGNSLTLKANAGIWLNAGAGNVYFYGSESNYAFYEGKSNTWKTGSDLKIKEDIYNLDSRIDDFYNKLSPKQYKYKGSGFIHYGFIANEVDNALKESNIQNENLSLISLPKNEDEYYSLCYNEFIALNVYEIQKLKKRVSELESQLQQIATKGEL